MNMLLQLLKSQIPQNGNLTLFVDERPAGADIQIFMEKKLIARASLVRDPGPNGNCFTINYQLDPQ